MLWAGINLRPQHDPLRRGGRVPNSPRVRNSAKQCKTCEVFGWEEWWYTMDAWMSIRWGDSDLDVKVREVEGR